MTEYSMYLNIDKANHSFLIIPIKDNRIKRHSVKKQNMQNLLGDVKMNGVRGYIFAI